MSEGRYTLEEASRVLNAQTCAAEGHDWEMVVGADGGLVRVVCGRCPKAYKVEEI